MNNYQPEDVQWIKSLLSHDDSDCNSATEDIFFLDEDNEEAHRFDLISAYIDNEVTLEERKLVQHWLDHDAAAKKLYRQLLGLQTNLRQIPVPATMAGDRLAEQVFRKVDGQRRRQYCVYGGAIFTAMAIAVGSYFVSGRNDPLSQIASSPSSISQERDHLMIALNHPIMEIPATEQPKENGQR
jgi:ferric-dicitrate binding protein FerR (iron transport regulator)